MTRLLPPPVLAAASAEGMVDLAASVVGLLVIVYFLREMGRGRNPVPEGPVPPSPWASPYAVWFGILLAVAWFFVQFSAVRFAEGWGVKSKPLLTLIAEIAGAAVALLFLGLLARHRRGRRPRAKGVLTGIVALFAVLPCVYAVIIGWQWLYRWLGRTWTQQPVMKELAKAPLWESALIAVVLAPFAEEVVFRGVLYSSIRRSLNRRAALYGSAFLFMLVHPESVWPAIFVIGVVLAWLYERTGTLVTSMTLHAAFNGWNLAGPYLARWLQPYLPLVKHWLKSG